MGGNSFSDKKSLSLTANNAISREPSLEIDGNNVYVVWEDWVTYAYPDIFFKRSVDGGNSFGKLINLSNNPSGSTVRISGHLEIKCIQYGMIGRAQMTKL